MRNLCYFCHYHRGDAKDKTVKIAGSLLIVTALFIFGSAGRVSSAAEQYSALASGLLPEPGYLIAQAEPTPPTSPTVSSPDTPAPPLPAQPSDKPAMPPPPEDDEQHEKFEHERAIQDRQNVLRDISRQKKDLGRLIRQLQRLKGAQDDVGTAQALLNTISERESAIRGAQETEEIRDALQEYWEAELWEEINKVRRKVELPRELNNVFKTLKKLERMLGQKAFQKLGFDVAALKARLAEWLQKHTEAKTAYGQGDFEGAEEALQEFRENHPGECEGSLHMLRGVREQMRGLRDKDFKAEVEELIAGPIGDLNSGECRDAREALEAIQRELGPIVWKKIMNSERQRRGIPEDVLGKLERLKEKFASEEAAEGMKLPSPGPTGTSEMAPAQE